MTDLEKIVFPLLQWYDQNKRDLAWRKEVNPYKTWVSEIMLQQTRVEQVKGYYDRFLKKLPTIYDLAKVDRDNLLKIWEGLGYYQRVCNMQKMAQIVVSKYEGKIPDTYEEIIKLPGIGDYTAGAILSIAYQKKIPCVDGNVLRVITRLTLDYSDIAKEETKVKIKEELTSILPDRVGDFNQALMELGALVCLPNKPPLCTICPLKELCLAHVQKKTDQLPVKTSKLSKRKEKYTVFILHYQDQILLQKRTNQGLLAALYELPNVTGHLTLKKKKIKNFVKYTYFHKEQKKSFKEQIYNWQNMPYDEINDEFTCPKGNKLKHVFSHLEWDLISYSVQVLETLPGLWVTEEERKATYPLPTAFNRLLEGEDQNEK